MCRGHTIDIDALAYYQFLLFSHPVHVFLIIACVTAASRIVFVKPVIIVDAIDIESP